MSTGLWVLLAFVTLFAITFWVLRVKILGKHVFPHLTQFKSLKQNPRWWIFGFIVLLGVAIWWFWTEITTPIVEWFGPGFPMWGYAAIVVGLIIVVGLFRMNKESRDKSFHVAEWVIGIGAVGGALILFSTWEKEDALCADKQAIISVPATGMVVDLHSCWAESQIALDLRQTGVTELAFNSETAVLKGRTIREFARIVTHTPGATDGHGMLRFNAVEMRRLGITTLPVFVGPSKHQPSAQVRLSDADIQALAQ
jgi:hypothetical protein